MHIAHATPRKLPPDEVLRDLFVRYPDASLTTWASQFGVSVERIRQKRMALGLPPMREIQSAKAAAAAALRRERDNEPTDHLCRVCGKPVTRGRMRRTRGLGRTCSPECARLYAGNSKYRYRWLREEQKRERTNSDQQT